MTITINGDTGITTPTYGGVDTSEYLVPVTQFKNRIINGAMVIDQRNAGASVTLAVGGVFPVDRWFGVEDTDGAMTAQQSTTAPTGFTNSVICTTTTADASLGATQIAVFAQRIEGFNIADLMWGTADAKTVTLSFWVRSSLTGTFGGSLRNGAANRSYPFTYTISSANTWEQKSVTIAGDTTGTWLTGNGIGINIFWSLGAGTDRSGTAGAWNSNNNVSATGAVSVIGTLNATWQITGVQFEVGSTATSFDYRPYGTELALCQRYYYRISATSNNQPFANAFCDSTTVARGVVPFPVTMRDRPTALEQSGTAANYAIVASPTGQNCTSVPAFGNSTVISSEINFTIASGLVAGQGCILRSGSASGASAYLGWSAEL